MSGLRLTAITALLATASWAANAQTPAPKVKPTAKSAVPKPATPTGPKKATPTPPTKKVTPVTQPKSRMKKTGVGSRRYDHRLRSLEERIIGLKERIFKTKTRLLLLKERILNDVIAEAKAIIQHRNEMGPSFKLVRLIYHLDGEKIYYQDKSSSTLATKKAFEIYGANILPGDHVLSVEMVYRGDSSVFTYLRDYLFRLRANFTFYATKGKITRVQAVGYKKGDITWELTKRPSIKFRVRQQSYTKKSMARSRKPVKKKRKP